jgi:hypothetical protein
MEISDIIKSLYRGILRRDPDEDGLKHYSLLLNCKELTLEQIIWIMSCSEERKDFGDIYYSGNYLTFWSSMPLVFLHIDKCAGASVQSWLLPNFAPWQIYQYNVSHIISPVHKFLTGHFPLNEVLPFVKNPIKIVVLREPKERITSLYRYMRRHTENKDEASVLAQTLDFSSWLTSNHPSVLSVISNIYVFRATGIFISPMDVDKSDNKVKKILDKALAVYRNFDVVGNTNNMFAFFQKASNILGIHMPSLIPEYNVGNDDLTNKKLLQGMTKRAKQAIEIHTMCDYIIYNEFFGQ